MTSARRVLTCHAARWGVLELRVVVAVNIDAEA